MSSQPVEVRQCPKCQQPTVLMVMEWKHESMGIALNQSTRDYRCQSCGKWFVRRSRNGVISLWIVGVIGMLGCFTGLPFLYLAWLQHTFDQRLPLVPNAPEPRLRFPGGAPKRSCGKCGGIAKAMNITRHTHNGLPTGTDYEYVCGQCGLQFTTENFLGHAFSTASGLLIGGIAAAFFLGAKAPGWRWGGSIVAALLAAFLLGQVATRVVNRFKHKPLEEHVL
jgi:hypothetical protein